MHSFWVYDWWDIIFSKVKDEANGFLFLLTGKNEIIFIKVNFHLAGKYVDK
jgi:hypothetical protein